MTNKKQMKINPDDLLSAWNWCHRLSRWEKVRLFFIADIPYFCDKVYNKITGKWLLK